MKKHILLCVTVLLCILLFCVKLTGNIVHVVFGTVFIVITVRHVWKQRKRIGAFPEKIRVINGFLMADFLLMIISGISYHFFKELLAIKIVHKMSGVLFFCLLLTHGLQFGKKAVRKERRTRAEAG